MVAIAETSIRADEPLSLEQQSSSRTGPVAAQSQDQALTLFAEHGTALFRFCRAMLRTPQEAEDVVQETFLKLLRHLQGKGDERNLRAWLFAVAANDCRDRMRTRWRWLPWTAATDARTVPAMEQDRDVAGAQRALELLRPRDRQLLSLRAQGLSYADIARAAGVRPLSVGKLLARAVARWKQEMEKGV